MIKWIHNGLGHKERNMSLEDLLQYQDKVNRLLGCNAFIFNRVRLGRVQISQEKRGQRRYLAADIDEAGIRPPTAAKDKPFLYKCICSRR